VSAEAVEMAVATIVTLPDGGIVTVAPSGKIRRLTEE
jgi:hypothetical protein